MHFNGQLSQQLTVVIATNIATLTNVTTSPASIALSTRKITIIMPTVKNCNKNINDCIKHTNMLSIATDIIATVNIVNDTNVLSTVINVKEISAASETDISYQLHLMHYKKYRTITNTTKMSATAPPT